MAGAFHQVPAMENKLRLPRVRRQYLLLKEAASFDCYYESEHLDYVCVGWRYTCLLPSDIVCQ